MTDKKQRTLAHTIMSESYGVGIELDADLPSVYRRLASRLKLILAGIASAPILGEKHTVPTDKPSTGRSALGGTA